MSRLRAASHQDLDHFQQVCRRAGVKVTHQRIVIYKAVAGSNEHPDVETVFRSVRRQLPTVSLDTVYRTLWLLADLGLISTLGPPRERVRFDGNTSKHHHFICSNCGLAQDFTSPEFDALPVPQGIERMGRVDATHVELRGLCSRCLGEHRENGESL